MSAITLEYPIENFPGLPMKEGLRFFGIIKAGKAKVQVSEPLTDESAQVARMKAAEHFLSNWSGKGTLLSQKELDQDPRLAYLTAKHVH